MLPEECWILGESCCVFVSSTALPFWGKACQITLQTTGFCYPLHGFPADLLYFSCGLCTIFFFFFLLWWSNGHQMWGSDPEKREKDREKEDWTFTKTPTISLGIKMANVICSKCFLSVSQSLCQGQLDALLD